MIYLDTSALTKLLVSEAESPGLRTWLVERAGHGDSAATSWLGRVELMRVVARYGDPNQIERARYLLDGLDMVPLNEPVIALAETIGPATLRSPDAIHLAAAASLSDELTAVVTYDRRMVDGCRAVGLTVLSPSAIR